MKKFTSFNEKRTGLAVMRIQPLHEGHCRIIDAMIRSHKIAILCIGSSQKKREKWDPFTFEERKQMVQNVYGDRLKVVQLSDLGTTEGTDDWVNYVIEKITKIGLPEPTDYYTGSHADARWYVNKFFLDGVSKWNNSESLSSKMHPDNTPYYSNGILKLLHIVDRNSNPVPAATDLRTFMELKDDSWKAWVPPVNWNIVEQNFPEEFKVKDEGYYG